MLLTCRSTVRSLIVRAVGDRPVGQARRRRVARTSASRALRPPGGTPRPTRASRRGEVGGRAESLEHADGRPRSPALRSHGRRARDTHRRSGPGPAPPRTGRRGRARLPTPAGGRPARPGRRLRRAARCPRPGWPSPAEAERRATSASSPGRSAAARGIAEGHRRPGRSRRQASSSLARTRSSVASASARRIDAAAASTSPLRQPQQRQVRAPGRRPQVAASPIPGLRRLEPATQSVELGQLVDRLPDGWLRRRSRQPLPRTLCLVGRLAPRAVESQQLRAKDEAVAAERDHVGLRLPPALQGRGPFLGTAEVEHRLARLDDRAVHDPRRGRATSRRRYGAVMASSSSADAAPRLTQSAMRDCPRPSRPKVASSSTPNRSAIDGDSSKVAVRRRGSPDAERRAARRDEQRPTLRAVVAALLDEPRGARRASRLPGRCSPRWSSIRPSEGRPRWRARPALANGLEVGPGRERWTSSGRPVRWRRDAERSRSSAPRALTASAALRASNASARRPARTPGAPTRARRSVDFWIGMRTAAGRTRAWRAPGRPW